MERISRIALLLLGVIALVCAAPYDEFDNLEQEIWTNPSANVRSFKDHEADWEPVYPDKIPVDSGDGDGDTEVDDSPKGSPRILFSKQTARLPGTVTKLQARLDSDGPRARIVRHFFPTVDDFGKCPRGYRKDKRGNCRQVW